MSWRNLLNLSRENKTREQRAAAPVGQTWGRMAQRDWLADVRQLIQSDAPVVVDAGAAGGITIKKLLKHFPDATIHAFEPLPQRIAQLNERFSDNTSVHIHAKALGREAKEVTFHVAVNRDSSSMLETGGISDVYHGENTAMNETIAVQQVRLDETIAENIDVLKMDLQGYELEALHGCTGLLSHMKAVVLEVEFIPLYEGQPLFAEIDQFMRRHHFRLLNLYGLFTQKDGQLTSGDALYLNCAIFGDHGGVAVL